MYVFVDFDIESVLLISTYLHSNVSTITEPVYRVEIVRPCRGINIWLKYITTLPFNGIASPYN